LTLREAVEARRSIRSFEDRPVDPDAVRRAIELAVQAPAPHHSSPWRFALLSDTTHKEAFSFRMGEAWRKDLARDGLEANKIEAIVGRSHQMLTATPLLVVCCADMSKAHAYPDERRARAEWSLFAHSTGAALQTFMLSLATEGIASCWISAPVFCGETVKEHLGLSQQVEPQALILVGYASPDYVGRPRPVPDASSYLVGPGSLLPRE
jgi:coenzyme F420-0:L-glutamate ligase / coenzyme F420-1:gamma-L-glutamate ligase